MNWNYIWILTIPIGYAIYVFFRERMVNRDLKEMGMI